MRMHLLLAAVFVVSPLAGVAGEKQVVDVKELAGSWQGWVTEQAAISIVANDRDGETCRRPRQDDSHDDAREPRPRQSRVRTAQVVRLTQRVALGTLTKALPGRLGSTWSSSERCPTGWP
jgi:hypothetical protein